MMTVQESLNRQLEYTGVLEWRNKGITGEGIKIWNGESNSGHGELTRSVIEQVAIQAEVISASSGYSSNSTELIDNNVFVTYKNERTTLDNFLSSQKPSILSQSQTGGGHNQAYIDYCKRIVKEYNLKIFNCGGNDGDPGQGKENISTKWPTEVSMVIGALDFYKGKEVRRAGYSSVGEALDFSQFTSFHSGTSFSTPFVAGQTAMIYQRYGEMGFEETYQYLKMIADDLGELGDDKYFGWGQPILPAWDKKYITMTTKEKNYYVNGTKLEMDTKPVNIEGNVFVPIRVISEALNAEIEWSMNLDKTIKVLINKGKTHIELNTENVMATINGKKVFLNFAPFIDENNRTLVPIRFIAEGLNCKVDWIQKEAKVMILEE